MTNPLADPYLVLTKVYSEGTYLKQAIAATPTEPLNRARTTKICYGVVEKDVYLTRIIAHNCEKQPKSAVKLILKIALYMLEFMAKHDYMVIDCAVELTKKLGKGGAAGFVNAFLRGYKLPDTPQGADERLSFECSVPLWLAKKVRRSYKSQARDILSAPSCGVCVRFVRGGQKYLEAEHTDTPFNGVYIFKNFVRDSGYDSGDYTFQSVGSVAICSAISPCERLLDACAAPGGKSVLLAGKCKSVVSCELHAHRAQLITSYANRMGAGNISVVNADSTVFNSDFEGEFDTVLCDVPCSGSGVINENPDIKLFRKEEDIAALNKTQLAIIDNCSRYVKKGGYLYYSTCSVLPEENDSVIYNFLQLHPEYAVDIPQSPLASVRAKYGLQFLPHISLGAGFYLCRLVKGG
ncbi:MAG: hypothetical protein LUF82_04455 [Clostridia bacterium]|nr:hypothetical protein [Clostridia bacterium]